VVLYLCFPVSPVLPCKFHVIIASCWEASAILGCPRFSFINGHRIPFLPLGRPLLVCLLPMLLFLFFASGFFVLCAGVEVLHRSSSSPSEAMLFHVPDVPLLRRMVGVHTKIPSGNLLDSPPGLPIGSFSGLSHLPLFPRFLFGE